MNWSAEYNQVRNYVRIVVEGSLIAEEHLQMMKDILAGKEWQKGMNVLFDCRKLEFDADSLAVIKQVSVNRQKVDSKIGSGKSALLMKSLTDHARGRQFQLLTESNVSASYQVFTDEEAAFRWLLA